MFGQNVSAADSMQISPAKPKGPSFDASSSFNNRNIFGGDNGTPGIFSQKPTNSPFGGLNIPSPTEQPSGEKAEGFAAKSAFGIQSPSTPAPTPFGGLFGATPTATKPAEPEKPTTPIPAQPFGGLFGSTPSSKPAEPEKVSTTTTSAPPFGGLFGATPANSKVAEPEKPEGLSTTPASAKPFGGLFGATPANSKAAEPEKSEAPSTTPALDKPFGGLFGATSTTATSQPAPSNIFSAQPTTGQTPSSNAFLSKTTEQTSISNPFAPKPASDETPATGSQSTKPLFGASAAPQPATGQNPFGNIFGAKPIPQNDAPSQPASTNLFSPKPAADQTLSRTAETQKSTPAEPFTAQPLPASAGAPPSQISGGIFGSSQSDPQPSLSQLPSSSSASLTSLKEKTSKVPMPDLSGIPREVRDEAELLWKLRTLNMGFKAEVATYDPEEHDFDDLIIFYMKVRSALGRPVTEHTPSCTDHESFSEENGQPHTATGDSHSTGEDENATSALFAKSFAASTSKSANQDNAEVKETAASTPKAPENPFKSLSTGDTRSSGITANGNFQPTTKPTTSGLGGNMFAKSTSNVQSSTPPGGNMFTKSTSSLQGSAPTTAAPKFGNGTSGVDFMAQFQKKADATAAAEKAKRKAEEFDSEEDDEEEWERQDAEKQRQKRAKLEGPKKKTVWDGTGFKIVDDETSTEEPSAALALPAPEESSAPSASPAPSSTSIFESSSQPLANSENIFGHLPATSTSADNAKDSDDSDDEGQRSPKRTFGKANGDKDSESATRESKPAKSSEAVEITKSSLNTPIPPPTTAASRSLFDRVGSTTPQNEKETPVPTNPFATLGSKKENEAAAPANPFATLGTQNAKQAAPANPFAALVNKSTSLFGQQAASDHTWKPDSPIKFSTSTAPTESSVPSTAPSSGGDNESSETGDGETAPGAIFDLSQSNAGEEEEKVVFECRARAFKLETGWTCQGTGVARLLQHPNGRARVVLRAEPSGQVVLNSLLKKDLKYSNLNNSVQLMVPKADQAPEHWAIRLKADIVKDFYAKVEEIKN